MEGNMLAPCRADMASACIVLRVAALVSMLPVSVPGGKPTNEPLGAILPKTSVAPVLVMGPPATTAYGAAACKPIWVFC